MAGSYSKIDLSQLAAPEIVETVAFETIVSQMVATLVALDGGEQFSALVESDPAFKVIQVCAYREVIMRQRVNDACKAVMLAFATGSDLDQIAARFGVSRLLLTPADDTTVPPTEAVYESDDDFRTRVPLSLEGYTSAGSEGSYIYHTLSASGDVKDASVTSPEPGEVVVYVLSRTGSGGASVDLLATVEAALNVKKVRPLTDSVNVFSASIIEYTVEASLTIMPGPSSDVVLAAAQAALDTYVAAQHKLGYNITIAGIHAALKQAGVSDVSITSPSATIEVGDGEAAYCTATSITVSGTGV